MPKLLNIYLQSAKMAFFDLFKSWIILPATILLAAAFYVLAFFCQPLGIIGGFILGTSLVAILSIYYCWLKIIIEDKKLIFSELKVFDNNLFFSIIGIGFIFWIVNDLLFFPIIEASGKRGLAPAFQLLLVILFNPVPETCYLNSYDSTSALKYSLEFVKKYWIEWFLPSVIMLTPLFPLYSSEGLLLEFATSNVLFPALYIIQAWERVSFNYPYLFIPISLILGHWYMLFRGYLFQKLERY